MEKILGENVKFQIEVEDSPKSLLLVLDRPCDYAIVPWRDAFHLAEVMEMCVNDVRREFTLAIPRAEIRLEQAQLRLNFHKGLVALLLMQHTDRLRFRSLISFSMVATAIRKTAQDSELHGRGVAIQYDLEGFLAKIHNTRHGFTQVVR